MRAMDRSVRRQPVRASRECLVEAVACQMAVRCLSDADDTLSAQNSLPPMQEKGGVAVQASGAQTGVQRIVSSAAHHLQRVGATLSGVFPDALARHRVNQSISARSFRQIFLSSHLHLTIRKVSTPGYTTEAPPHHRATTPYGIVVSDFYRVSRTGAIPCVCSEKRAGCQMNRQIGPGAYTQRSTGPARRVNAAIFSAQ